MKHLLSNLPKSLVFKYFYDITQIPRGSSNERDISNYLVSFAKERNLKVIQDEALNVIIKKSGSVGYENAPIVILQGHMDMVCEKNKDINHDFDKDPIELEIEGDYIKARGTTLGADNGIALAYCLAILDDNTISHPPLEVLITTGEEVGMIGASKLNKENITGSILINIDSEKEGELLVSCSGGIRSKIKLTVELDVQKDGFYPYKISIRGLKGGHSGTDIHKERANANKLLGRILNDVNSKKELFISGINGGSKMNSIPREAETIIFIKKNDENDIRQIIDLWNKVLKNELSEPDKNILIEIDKEEEKNYRFFSKALTNKIISVLMLMPQGVQSMSTNIEGLVESSSNLGVVETRDDEVIFSSAIRSSVQSLKYDIVEKMNILCNLVGAAMDLESDYPAWEYKEESYIRNLFTEIYKKMNEIGPKVTAIHAGLECGILNNILGDIDMISFGPNMYDVHTPNEKLSISSTERTYSYLLNVLKEIK